jgi:predicted Zn-dependent protease
MKCRFSVLTVITSFASLTLSCVSTDVEPIAAAAFAPEQDERGLWNEAAKIDQSLEKKPGLLHRDAELEQYLDGVVNALLEASHGESPPVHVRVLMHPDANAFALPNGSIYVHSGLLAPMTNEAQLATVLGHELAHFLKRHSLRESREEQNHETARKVAVSIVLVLAAAGGDPGAALTIAQGSSRLAEQVIRTQLAGYSRDLEREADAEGIAMLRAAGYDSREALAVFELLRADADATEEKIPYLYSSHPRLQERIDSLRELLAEVPPPAGELRVGQSDYEQRITGVLIENSDLELRAGAVQPAQRALERYTRLRPNDPRGARTLAHAYRRSGPEREHVTRAALTLEDAAARFPNDAAIQLELGLLYRELDDRDRARVRLARYLELAPDAEDRPIIQRYVAELQ